MTENVINTANGAIVYDPGILNQMSDSLFTAGNWPIAESVKGTLRSAGRGNTKVVSDGGREFVLRHYVRGGFPGRIIHDSYLWTGERKTRSFSEWYLLARLNKLGLPVPKPAAARYLRKGLFYKADLMTVRVPGIRSLAERLTERPGTDEFWANIGAGLYRFHNAGVYHADLNAYNVQLDANDSLVLLDFDRGKLMEPGVWRQKNLARLHRSLQKIRSLDRRICFVKANWNQLLEGYFSESRSA